MSMIIISTAESRYVEVLTEAKPPEIMLVMNSTKNITAAIREKTLSKTVFSLRITGSRSLYASFSKPA